MYSRNLSASMSKQRERRTQQGGGTLTNPLQSRILQPLRLMAKTNIPRARSTLLKPSSTRRTRMSIGKRQMPKAPNRANNFHREAGDRVSLPVAYVMKFVSIGSTRGEAKPNRPLAVTPVHAVCLTVAARGAFVGTKLQCSVVGVRPNERDLHRP